MQRKLVYSLSVFVSYVEIIESKILPHQVQWVLLKFRITDQASALWNKLKNGFIQLLQTQGYLLSQNISTNLSSVRQPHGKAILHSVPQGATTDALEGKRQQETNQIGAFPLYPIILQNADILNSRVTQSSLRSAIYQGIKRLNENCALDLIFLLNHVNS